MKLVLRDRNQVVLKELDIPTGQIPDNHKPRVIFIEDVNACYALVGVEGDTGYFDEVDYMKVGGLDVKSTPVNEIQKH